MASVITFYLITINIDDEIEVIEVCYFFEGDKYCKIGTVEVKSGIVIDDFSLKDK